MFAVTDEAREGAAAFAEKRKPDFTTHQGHPLATPKRMVLTCPAATTLTGFDKPAG